MNEVALHFVTPVWGSEYTRTFLEVTLPTLLAPGNIPAVPNLKECVYRIYTAPEDEALIRDSTAYAALTSLVRTEFVQIRQENDKYVTSSDCYRIALAHASAARSAALLLIPDMVFADGGIRSIVRLLKDGKRAVLVMGLRAFKETMVPEVCAEFSHHGCIIVPPRALVRVGMRHLHSIMLDHIYESDSEAFNPSVICWRAGSEGFLVHTFHLHPVAVFPNDSSLRFEGTIDDDLVEAGRFDREEIHIVTDSDELGWFEISRRDHFARGPINRQLDQIVAWMDWATTEYHRLVFRTPIRIHAGDLSGAEWDRARLQAEEFVDLLLSAYARAVGSWVLRVKLRAMMLERRAAARLEAAPARSKTNMAESLKNLVAVGVVAGARTVSHLHRVFRRLG